MSQTHAPFCQIKNIARKIQQLDEHLKTEFAITLDEAILLCCLSEKCKCQGNIAGETGLTPTQASRVLSAMEKKILVERTIGTEDKRKMVFTLTPLGTEKLRQITPLGIQFLQS